MSHDKGRICKNCRYYRPKNEDEGKCVQDGDTVDFDESCEDFKRRAH